MSVSTPDNNQPQAQTIVLPPGTKVSPGLAGTRTNDLGVTQQGTSFNVTLPSGTITTVFIPNNVLGNVPATQAIFDEKINGLSTIPVGQS